MSKLRFLRNATALVACFLISAPALADGQYDGHNIKDGTLPAGKVAALPAGGSICNPTGGSAAPTECTQSQAKAALGLSSADISGLGTAATKNVGTTTGTVAAGDDSRITGAAQKSANLSDLGSASTARGNLGLGNAATKSTGTAAGTVAAGDDSRITGAEQSTNKDAASGYAGLDGSSKLKSAEFPALGSGDVSCAAGNGVCTVAAGAVTDDKAALANKPSICCVAESNIASLSGEQTIDGQLTNGSYVLLTGQTTGSENGFWRTGAGAWTRPTWYAAGSTAQSFQFITTFVRLGSSNKGSVWRMTTSGVVTIGTTATTWLRTDPVLNAATVTASGAGSRALADWTQYLSPPTAQASLPQMEKWRACIAKVRAGTGRCTVAIVGDSTSVGAGTGSGGTGSMTAAYPTAWPGSMGKILSSSYGIPVSDQSLWTDAFSPVSYATYDTRVTLGSGWAFSTSTFGGRMLNYTTGSASTFSFTPEGKFDTIKIWYLRGGSKGSFAVNVDGGASLGTINCNGVTALLSQTYTVADAAHTINLVAANDNTFFVLGIETYDSTIPAVDLIRSGHYGSVINDYNQTGNAYSSKTVLQALAPDLTLFAETINDSNNGTSLSSYLTDMQAVITAAQVSGDVILGTGPPSNTTQATNGTLAGFVTTLLGLAQTNSAPLFAIGAGGGTLPSRWVSYANISAQFPYADTVHPALLGHWDLASAWAQAVANSVGAGPALSPNYTAMTRRTGTWATISALTPADGTIAHVTDIGANGSEWTYNATDARWRPFDGNVTLLQESIPFIMPSSGSIANNGALTLTTALPTTFANCYMYFPASAISAGSSAGVYFVQMSSTTVGTIYNNTYTSGAPSIPASPTAFSTTGPGAYTQTTGSFLTMLSLSIKGKALGKNGRLNVHYIDEWNNTAGSKQFRFLFAGSNAGSTSKTTNSSSQNLFSLSNRGSESAQVSYAEFSTAGSGNSTNLSADTTSDQTLAYAINLATATDFAIIGSLAISLITP